MKRLLFSILVTTLFSACQKRADQSEGTQSVDMVKPVEAKSIEPGVELEQKAVELLEFASQKGQSTQTAILIDLSRHSGQNRFFIWDLQANKALHEGLVAHGHCKSGFYDETVTFSNTVNSTCSSEGKYSIGERYLGQYGEAYKLHGLEESNSAAFERFIVMHGHDCVPDKPRSASICNSEGCPTLSPAMMKTAIEVIDKSEKPMLMWIFK